jgi:hypothetical protein
LRKHDERMHRTDSRKPRCVAGRTEIKITI